MAREQDIYTEARNATRDIWDGIHKLGNLADELAKAGTTGTLPDGEGENEGITRGDLLAVVGTTYEALDGLLDAGHGTNIAKLL